jgi:Leucine Rich repeat
VSTSATTSATTATSNTATTTTTTTTSDKTTSAQTTKSNAARRRPPPQDWDTLSAENSDEEDIKAYRTDPSDSSDHKEARLQQFDTPVAMVASSSPPEGAASASLIKLQRDFPGVSPAVLAAAEAARAVGATFQGTAENHARFVANGKAAVYSGAAAAAAASKSSTTATASNTTTTTKARRRWSSGEEEDDHHHEDQEEPLKQQQQRHRRRRLDVSPFSRVIPPMPYNNNNNNHNNNSNQHHSPRTSASTNPKDHHPTTCRFWTKIETLHCTGSIGPMIAAAAAAAILPIPDLLAQEQGHDHKSQSNGNLKRDDNDATSSSPLPPPPPPSPANPPSHKESDHRQSAASSSISPMSCSVSLPMPPPASILSSSSSCLQVQQLWFTGSVPIAHNPRYSLGTVSCYALQSALQNPCLGLQTLCLKGTRLDPPGLQALCSGLATSTCLTSLRLSHCAIYANHVRSSLTPALAANAQLRELVLAHCKLLPVPLSSSSSWSERNPPPVAATAAAAAAAATATGTAVAAPGPPLQAAAAAAAGVAYHHYYQRSQAAEYQHQQHQGMAVAGQNQPGEESDEYQDDEDGNDYMVPLRDASHYRPTSRTQRRWRARRRAARQERPRNEEEMMALWNDRHHHNDRNEHGTRQGSRRRPVLENILEDGHDDDDDGEYEDVVDDDDDDDTDDCLSDLLEGLKCHPTLEILTIHGMTCSTRAVSAMADLLVQPTCRLLELGLKNNVVPEDRLDVLPLCRALVTNTTLETLQLVGNNLTNEEIVALSNVLFPRPCSTMTTGSSSTPTNTPSTVSSPRALWPLPDDHRYNSTLATLNLTANQISDEGLQALAQGLAQVHRSCSSSSTSIQPQNQNQIRPRTSSAGRGRGLRQLNVQRNPFTILGQQALIESLATNLELERLDMDGTYHSEKAYYLNLNRGGRRLLLEDSNGSSRHASSSSPSNGGTGVGGGSVPLGLWPHVLSRVNQLHFGRHPQQRTAQLDVLYCLLRDGPALLQRRGVVLVEGDLDQNNNDSGAGDRGKEKQNVLGGDKASGVGDDSASHPAASEEAVSSPGNHHGPGKSRSGPDDPGKNDDDSISSSGRKRKRSVSLEETSTSQEKR